MAGEEIQEQVPPTGEEIHLPGPSILPLLTAAGITLSLVGVTTYWELSVAGGLLTLACVWRWIGDTRRDIAELPLEHSD
jgi:hypothetical protein